MRPIIILCAAFCIGHSGLADDKLLGFRPIEMADSVLAIYPENLGLVRGPRIPAIILVIWPDGQVIWSTDRVNGGPPYFSGKVEPADVLVVLADVERDGLFADERLNDAHFGPDSGFTTLLVKWGKRQVKMQSWHERYEANGKTIAGSHGVSGLEGKRRFEALAKEPADYLHYRLVWSETRGRLIDLIPAAGKQVEGGPIMKDRRLVWQDAPLKVENNRDK